MKTQWFNWRRGVPAPLPSPIGFSPSAHLIRPAVRFAARFVSIEANPDRRVIARLFQALAKAAGGRFSDLAAIRKLRGAI
jgi:hypothetical protein